MKNEITADFLKRRSFENTKYTKNDYVYTEKLTMLIYMNKAKIIYGRGNSIHTIAS